MTACRAPELSIKVLAETRRKIIKVLFNNYVERLVVSAPCNFNLHLAMAALKVGGGTRAGWLSLLNMQTLYANVRSGTSDTVYVVFSIFSITRRW